MTLVVRPAYEALERQLVTTFGLPLLLHSAPALLLHACAAMRPGDEGAHIFCATSGTGKSTLLAGLIAGGWRAVAEDICTIDLRTPAPVVWPGPSWLRLRAAGPEGASARFHTKDKTAWDITPWLVDHTVPLARVVFLDQPSGAEVQVSEVTGELAVAGLAAAAVWLAHPRDRAEATFAPVVRLAKSVPALRLRLPYSGEAAAVAAEVLSERRDGRR